MKRRRLIAPRKQIQPWQLERVVSGAQVGADIAGLKAAKAAGIPTGGYMPLGYLTLHGMRPEYAEEFGIKETTNTSYPTRTWLNVKESQGTVLFCYRWNSPGTICTNKALTHFGRTCFNVNVPDTGKFGTPEHCANWLRHEQIRVLNVAGNSDEHIEAFVEDYLLELFRLIGYLTV